MSLPRKARTFLDQTSADRWLFCEAVALLGLARLAILTVPFRLLASLLSRAPETSTCDQALLLRVRRAVTTAARNVPWNAVCLPQAMAAKAMLARRGRGSALHLGATFNAKGKLISHAWLSAGGIVVVGEGAMADMSPLARFG